MKLGLGLGYSGADLNLDVERVLRAERLGYDSVWTAEVYGSDAITPLAYLAALTKHIRLGTGIEQVQARTPALAAMEYQTLEALAGRGRVIAGLGLSGPQIIEGWYGRPWGKPYWVMRDYVSIMKQVFKREAPVEHNGREIQLPYNGPGAIGLGKPLRSILHTNPDLPIWLGSGGEANVRLAGELADGLMPLGFVPSRMPEYRALVEEGIARAGNGKSIDSFDFQTNVQVRLTDDVQAGLDALKPNVALYVGGMGHRTVNFHAQQMAKRGYPEAADRIQEAYLSGRREEAAAAVPDDFVDEGALVGPKERIAERYAAWRDCGLTGMTIATTQDEVIELLARLADVRPRE